MSTKITDHKYIYRVREGIKGALVETYRKYGEGLL